MSKLSEIDEDCLDPCCAKELSDRRKAFDLKQQLDSVDRSTAKLKQMAIYGGGGRIVRCPCMNKDCQILDYPLLISLRNDINKVNSMEEEGDDVDGIQNNKSTKAEEDDEEDDSDAELDNLLNEFDDTDDQLKLINENRFEMMRKQQEQIELAQSFGFGIHRALPHDDHNATEFISSCPRVICHVCNDKSRLCAQLDIYLENKAQKYPGTAFLRVFPTPFSPLAEYLKMNCQNDTSGLVVLMKNNIINSTNNLTQFGDESFLDLNQLDTWLDRTGVLEASPQPSEWSKIKWPSNTKEENEEVEYYACGHPGCKKTFRHDHVAQGLPMEYRSTE